MGVAQKFFNWFAGGGAPASSLLDGLMHAWHLDEAGTTTSDLRLDSVGGIHLTPSATLMTQAAGKSGLAYTNDGSLRFLSVDSDDMRNIVNDSFTFSVWINLSSIAAHSGIFSCWDAAQNDRSYLLLYSAGQGLRWIFSPDGTLVVQGDNVHSISADTWYHVVCWFDKPAGKFRMSVDNGPTTEADVTSIHKSSQQFTIGSYIPAAGGIEGLLNGQIDEVYCWNRVLTADERTELYNAGAGKFYPFAS